MFRIVLEKIIGILRKPNFRRKMTILNSLSAVKSKRGPFGIVQYLLCYKIF